MAAGMETTKYQNVYQRTSAKRRNLRDGKMDVCYYFIYRADGKKVWEKAGWKSEGMTAQMAYQLRVDRLQAVRLGEPEHIEPVPTRIMTFGEAWKLYSEKWLPNLAKPRDEQNRYDNHIGPRFGDTPLEAITPLELETFKQELLAKGLAASSVKYVLGNIRRVYNKLVEWELSAAAFRPPASRCPRWKMPEFAI